MTAELCQVTPVALALHVRPMAVTDLERVMAVEVGAYSFPWSRGNFIDSIAAGYVAELLIDDTCDEVVGYYVAMPGVDELHLLNFTVAPACQGRGHARTLLAAVVHTALQLALGTLWLEVRVSNERALKLYTAAGFHQAGLRPGYYPAAGGRREDAVVMTRLLDTPCDEASHAVG